MENELKDFERSLEGWYDNLDWTDFIEDYEMQLEDLEKEERDA